MTQKYRIRFFFELGVTAYLWAGDDFTLDTFDVGPIEDKLPLSDEIRQRAEEISDWYQTSVDWDYPPAPTPWSEEECDQFRIIAREFFEDLQQELGDDFELLYDQIEPRPGD